MRLAKELSRKCSIVGCKRPKHARGYCSTHYSEFRKKGFFKVRT